MDTNSKETFGNGYVSILSDEVTVDALTAFCIGGGLRASNLRSIVWRIQLKCLPISKIEWIQVTSRARSLYAELKEKNIPNPHDECFSQDPQVNNPLDQTDHNPWQRYFADHDLRDLISKDVGRTYPELEFFQQDHVRRMMCDILLIYAKEHPFVSYKQGMHEVLAPLIFVLFSDQQSFSHCKESGSLKMLSTEDLSILSHVYDPEYLENDSYAMFCEIMLELAKWYEDGSPANSTQKLIEAGPYMRIQDAIPTSQILHDLLEIGRRLNEVDPMLSAHLRSFDIPPQIYGIRWLRLLFGREFAVHDLLYVWDVILCDRPFSKMVECIFLAMLVQIRHLLLQSDYSGCLQYLMRYPPVVDVCAFIQEALHLRNPKKYASRLGISSLGNFSHLTVTGTNHPNRSRQGTAVPSKITNDETGSGFRNITSSMLSKVKNTVLEKPSSTSATPMATSKNIAQSNSGPPKWEKEVLLMEEQVACLQTKLNERDVICSDAANGIEWCVEQLRNGSEHTVSELCDKLMEIKRNLTVNYPNGQFFANIPQPRHIQRENEMVDLSMSSAK